MSYSIDTGPALDELFDEIAGTRARYETLRSTHGPLEERARLVSRLHALRAQAASLTSLGA